MEVYYHPKAPGEARALLEYSDRVSENLGEAFWSELISMPSGAMRGVPKRARE